MRTFSSIVAALAAVTPALAQIPSDYSWAVTGWSAGCARSGCYYDFNITGPFCNTGNICIPSFKAYCEGYNTYESTDYTDCTLLDPKDDDDRRVNARLAPSTGDGAHITVSYRFPGSEASSYYNFTGRADSIYNQFVAPLQEFNITPSEAWGVAK